MLDIPKIDLSAEWDLALLGFEMNLRAQNRTPRTLLTRMSYARLLARWFQSQGITDPEAWTRSGIGDGRAIPFTGLLLDLEVDPGAVIAQVADVGGVDRA
jgi:hypothetical protein